MAFSGTHITCCLVGNASGAALAAKPIWSQTMASAGTTSRAAPGNPEPIIWSGMFEVRSSADIYVAIGKTPDASQASGVEDAARFFIPANETRNIFVQPGEKLAWIAV